MRWIPQSEFSNMASSSPETKHYRQNTEWYWPERIYFDRLEPVAADEAAKRAARSVTQCVARHAARYEAWIVGVPDATRRGTLPRAVMAREAAIGEIFDWGWHFSVPTDYPPIAPLLGLRLYRRGESEPLLEMANGFPTELLVRLTEAEFAALQNCLEQQRLPRDLYFPQSARRTVVEPVNWLGGVVLGNVTYSPLGWRQRETRKQPPADLPSEEERRRAFLHACARCLHSLHQRLELLRDASGEVSAGRETEIKDLSETAARVHRIQQRYADRLGAETGAGDATSRPASPADSQQTDHRLSFEAACGEFVRALSLRQTELEQFGGENGDAAANEIREVEDLLLRIHDARMRALGGNPHNKR